MPDKLVPDTVNMENDARTSLTTSSIDPNTTTNNSIPLTPSNALSDKDIIVIPDDNEIPNIPESPVSVISATQVNIGNESNQSSSSSRRSSRRSSSNSSYTRKPRQIDAKTTSGSPRSRSVSSSRASSPRPKKYICDHINCGKAYSRPSLLEQHLRVHSGDRPFKCTFEKCDESFIRKDHLERHKLKHISNEEKPFHCKICNKGVNSIQHLKRHEKTHYKSFACTYPNCSESFYKHQSLKAHIRAAHQESNLICKVCNKEFTRPGRLNEHVMKNHLHTSKLICDYPDCYKSFHVWSALQLHIKTDHPRLECEVCGKKCVGQSGLVNHMKIHNEDTVIKLWKCNVCCDKFQKKEDTVRHYAEKHPLIELPEDLQYDLHDIEKEKHKDREPPKHYTYYKEKKEREKELKKRQRETEENSKSNAPKESSRLIISDYGFPISSPTQNGFKKQQTNRIPSSPDVLDLLIDNIDQRLSCKYTNCHRIFRKEYDLERHLAWHKKQDSFLEEKVNSILSDFKYDENDNIIELPKYMKHKSLADIENSQDESNSS